GSRSRPRGIVLAGAGRAVVGRSLARRPAALSPRGGGRARHDRLAAARRGARAPAALLPAPRPRGARRRTAAAEARLPDRARRPDSGPARPRLERGCDHAWLAGERSVLAAVDRRRLLEAELCAPVPASAVAAVVIRPRRRQHARLSR